MTSRTEFISGRTGRGAAYVSDVSGAEHDKFMRLSAQALLPLGLLAAGSSSDCRASRSRRPAPKLAGLSRRSR